MKVLFPRVQIQSLGDRTARAKRLIANPKAVAAQTFKSSLVAVEFFESRVWAEISEMFDEQSEIGAEQAPLVQLPVDGRWIAYPYAVVPDSVQRRCIVWTEQAPSRKFVRHIRVYSDDEIAQRDNQVISRILGSVG